LRHHGIKKKRKKIFKNLFLAEIHYSSTKRVPFLAEHTKKKHFIFNQRRMARRTNEKCKKFFLHPEEKS